MRPRRDLLALNHSFKDVFQNRNPPSIVATVHVRPFLHKEGAAWPLQLPLKGLKKGLNVSAHRFYWECPSYDVQITEIRLRHRALRILALRGNDAQIPAI